jgi:hypothetical protein
MCLAKLMTKEERREHQPEVSRNGFMIGWKVFGKDSKEHLQSYYIRGTKFLPRRKCLNELDYRDRDDDGRKTIDVAAGATGSRYRKGFHVYLKPVFGGEKVYFREPVAWGWQKFGWNFYMVPTVVAKKIFIPQEATC